MNHVHLLLRRMPDGLRLWDLRLRCLGGLPAALKLMPLLIAVDEVIVVHIRHGGQGAQINVVACVAAHSVFGRRLSR